MHSREQIIAEARRWIGTRFLHQGRRCATGTDRGGVDCLGLLVGVAAALNVRDEYGRPLAAQDITSYSRQPDAARLHQSLAEHLLPQYGPPRPGDIGLFTFDGAAQHLAIFGARDEAGESCLTLIHAYAPAHRVVEHGYDASWAARLVACFALPGVAEDGEREAGAGEGGDAGA
jgi:cell wall-associated NlpC family hydrolase